MADTPGIVQDGQKYIAEMQTETAAQSVDYEAAVQALSVEALGHSMLGASESDKGLGPYPVYSGFVVDDGTGETNYLGLLALAALVYFVFIKKGKSK